VPHRRKSICDQFSSERGPQIAEESFKSVCVEGSPVCFTDQTADDLDLVLIVCNSFRGKEDLYVPHPCDKLLHALKGPGVRWSVG
jgi:hypothetical protein